MQFVANGRVQNPKMLRSRVINSAKFHTQQSVNKRKDSNSKLSKALIFLMVFIVTTVLLLVATLSIGIHNEQDCKKIAFL
jgi:hypothetical protein